MQAGNRGNIIRALVKTGGFDEFWYHPDEYWRRLDESWQRFDEYWLSLDESWQRFDECWLSLDES